MIIDCGSCAVAGPACDDCVVSVLLGVPDLPLRATDLPPGATDLPLRATGLPPGATDLPDDHAAAFAVLAESGLVPPLRLVRSVRAS